MLSFSACGGGKSEEEAKAEAVLSEIKTLYADKQYESAMKMIDSLMQTYPGIIDVQRKAMNLQTLIIEKQTLDDSIRNEMEYLRNKSTADSLLQNLKFVKTADMAEGYYAARDADTDPLIRTTKVEPRIDENGDIYLMSNLYGHAIRHTRLVATAGGESRASVSVPLTNPRNYRFKDDGTPVEMVTFTAKECDSLCLFISQSKGRTVKLIFEGKSKKYPITLSPKNVADIAAAYDLYQAKAAMRSAELNRLKFMKKLQLTRRQIRQTATNIQGERE